MSQTNDKTQIQILQDKLEIPAHYIVYSLLLSLLLVSVGYLDFHLTNIIGLVLPLYLTIKSIERPESGDDTQWITYWSIFVPLLFLDLFVGDFLRYLPLFYFLKLTFLIWMFLPNFKGAKILHDKVIAPNAGSLNINLVKSVAMVLKNHFQFAGESFWDSFKEVANKILETRQTDEDIGELREQPIEESNLMGSDKLHQQQGVDTSSNSYDIKSRSLESDEPRSRESILRAQ